MFKVYFRPCKNSYTKVPLTYKSFKFSGGEVQVKLDFFTMHVGQDIYIKGNIESADDIMELAMLSDAIHRAHNNSDSQFLTIPYFPYARQDRVMNSGEALGAKVMAGIINNMKFKTVTVFDAHSDVTTALLDNVINISSSSFLSFFPINKNDCVLVAPDAGANKKVMDVAKGFKLEMVRADKIRDTKTGEITGTKVYSEHIGDKNFLIVDDICDGGRTFIELAKVLKPLTNGKIYLYVTHGIFSKGLDVFDDIDKIFCPNIFSSVDQTHSKIQKVID